MLVISKTGSQVNLSILLLMLLILGESHVQLDPKSCFNQSTHEVCSNFDHACNLLQLYKDCIFLA